MKPGALTLPDDEEDISTVRILCDMVDLNRVLFITGISGVGCQGNSRTIWEVEAYGESSLQVYIEMAWIMKFNNHHNRSPVKCTGGEHYIGPLDAKTGLPAADIKVKPRHGSEMQKHGGFRLVGPKLDNSCKTSHTP